MNKHCINKKFIIDAFAIIFQIVFIFTFLTLFFFLYVVNIEKKQFEKQINFIIDEIITNNILDNINDIIPNDSSKDLLTLVLYGILDISEKKIIENSKKIKDDISKKNNDLKNKIFNILYIILGVLIVTTIILIMLNVCIPLLYQIKEALWVVLFVAITEFIFLQIIASKYMSADPYSIKRVFAQSVKSKVKKYLNYDCDNNTCILSRTGGQFASFNECNKECHNK